MKTKPIPESWHKFHRLVNLFFNDSDYSLTECVQIAGCSARMPRIYLALGWITPSPKINCWFFTVPEIITPEMAEQIREESKRMENASDPLGLKIKEWKKGIATINDNISSELDAEYLICDVYVNTSLEGTFRKPWTSSAGAYLFDVDVQSLAKMPTLEETKELIQEKRAEELKKFWDADLVTELRRRGYEVTAKKTVEL